jgi:pimeloyl-ACP methyl ester carboxylesterase
VRVEVGEWSRTGEPLLFLSGMGRTAHAFDEFAPRLADRYRVLGITRRGWGRSTQPPDGYDSQTLVGDIVAVMDSLHIPAAHVGGWSYGGNEATWLAVRHPERVRSVILLDSFDNSLVAGTFAGSDTMPWPASPPPRPPKTLHDVLEAERSSPDGGNPLSEVCATSRVSSTGRYLGPVTADSVVGFRVLLGSERLPYSAVQQPVLAFYATVRGIEDMFPEAARLDSAGRARAALVTATVQRELLAGRRRIERALPGARIVEIPGATHAIFRSHPRLVLHEMRVFLDSITPFRQPEYANRACCTVTIRARVPDGTGKIYLSGSIPELGPWRADARLMSGTGRHRTVEVPLAPGTTLEYKFTLGSWDREALTSAGKIPANYRLTVARDTVVTHEVPAFKRDPRDYIADWRNSGVLGRLVYWTDVRSKFLGLSRHVEVWLPPGYDSATSKRYPVLYMHDGQNLFDPRIANTGVDWGVDEAVVRLAKRGVIPPIIVVGVWSSNRRGFEYSPWDGAPDYARFLIEELMPRVNRTFRTLTGPEHTAVMGSSMGGLLSFYLVTHHPDVFGACGCVSTHFPLSEAVAAQVFPGSTVNGVPDTTPYVVRDIRAGLDVPKGARYWFDYGTLSLDSAYGPTHEKVRAWLVKEGLVEGRDFVIRRYEGATHNEASWRARLEDPLRFLFGERP